MRRCCSRRSRADFRRHIRKFEDGACIASGRAGPQRRFSESHLRLRFDPRPTTGSGFAEAAFPSTRLGSYDTTGVVMLWACLGRGVVPNHRPCAGYDRCAKRNSAASLGAFPTHDHSSSSWLIGVVLIVAFCNSFRYPRLDRWPSISCWRRANVLNSRRQQAKTRKSGYECSRGFNVGVVFVVRVQRVAAVIPRRPRQGRRRRVAGQVELSAFSIDPDDQRCALCTQTGSQSPICPAPSTRAFPI